MNKIDKKKEIKLYKEKELLSIFGRGVDFDWKMVIYSAFLIIVLISIGAYFTYASISKQDSIQVEINSEENVDNQERLEEILKSFEEKERLFKITPVEEPEIIIENNEEEIPEQVDQVE